MFTIEAEKVLGLEWDVYSSGGGCYHAQKEFTTLDGQIAVVEVHWSGGASMYHNEDKELVNAKKLAEEDYWSNYIELAWINDFTNELEKSEKINVFSEEIQDKIVTAMVKFTECYDAYMY